MEEKEKTKLHFDPTINLGHIITFIGFMATIGMGWVTLDKRVLIVESNLRTQEIRDKGQDNEIQSNAIYVTTSMNDVKRSLERLTDKVDRINAQYFFKMG